MTKFVNVIGPDRKVWEVIDRDEARSLVAEKTGVWCNHSRDIRLVAPAPREFTFRGPSCKPGVSLIERYIAARSSDKDPGSIAIVESWRSR